MGQICLCQNKKLTITITKHCNIGHKHKKWRRIKPANVQGTTNYINEFVQSVRPLKPEFQSINTYQIPVWFILDSRSFI